MATKEEWKEYFETVNGRSPTIEEFTAAMKSGEISNNAEQTNTPIKNAAQDNFNQSNRNQEPPSSYQNHNSSVNKWDDLSKTQKILYGAGSFIAGFLIYNLWAVNLTGFGTIHTVSWLLMLGGIALVIWGVLGEDKTKK